MWIARDEDGGLYLFTVKPGKDFACWYNSKFDGIAHVEIDCTLFPEVKWEDEEPTEVELVIKKKP